MASEHNPPRKGPIPIDSANIFSRVSFWYSFPLLKISTKRAINENDLWEITEIESASVNGEKLKGVWEKEKARRPKSPSLFKAFVKANMSLVLFTMFITSLWCGVLIFIPIYLVRNLILFVQADEYSASGWGYVAGFFGASLIQSVLLHQVFWMSFRLGSRMRSGAAMLIYEKALRLKTTGNIGEVANLVSNDCQRVADFGLYFNFAWMLPVEVSIVGGLLIWKVGWAGIIGLVFMFIMAFWQLYTGRMVRDYKNNAAQFTDKRVQLMSEILIAIKLVKFYAWEVPFAKRVAEARGVEVKQIRNLAFLRAINFILMFVSTPFTTLFVFAAFVGAGNTLGAENAFVALALINCVRFPMTLLPFGVRAIAEGRVASKRIQRFLNREELPPRQPFSSLSNLPGSAPVVEIVDGDFSWDNQEVPTLRNINLRVPRGSLIAIVGPVGSGKSTLLASLMEQITRVRGSVTIHGGLAYVPQQAWIQNLTLRDNILFGNAFDEEKYRHTLQVCALEADLKQLLAGDQTEIGERGINLSGGQKQRVSIARAVYADEDLVLLDDPLSAVDQHVGKHLFEKCIKGALRGKTVILVTHQLQYLPQCDSVVVMSNGTINTQGTFNELMSKMDFSDLIGQHVDLSVEDEHSAAKEEKDEKEKEVEEAKHVVENDKQPVEEPKKPEEPSKSDGKLTKVEAQKSGSVTSDSYKQYIWNGGTIVAILVLIFHLISQSANVVSFWWLTYWISHPNDDAFNIGIYAMLVGAVLVFCTIRELLYQSFTLRASTNIHNLMFRTILRAPMSFFDVTPLGRILNRFAVDMDIIDYLLPDMSMQGLHNSFQVLGVIVLISVFLNYMPLLLIPMAIMFLTAQYFYRNANRDIKRIDSASKSPLFQHMSATLQGLGVLRAFRQEPRFANQNLGKVDHAVRSSLQMYMIQRWLGFCLDFITICLVFSTAALCVGLRDTINASQAGLAITYSMQLAGTFQWTVRTVADSEAQMTSVERILEYCNPDLEDPIIQTKKIKRGKKPQQHAERLPYEAPPIIPDSRPEANWPTEGVVTFETVTVEYVKGSPVLYDLSFETRPMEKIGIVGRTGAGKSTVALALFRMMECAQGRILIDGQDISLIGTNDLRSRVGIIPQDPVLFEGTVRSNLDPFGAYDDNSIWKTLQQVHLENAISSLPNKLDAVVEANGENWSVGQRQLICIGRALLKHCKVLVLDEATAAVDLETDSLIQETIRENFADCTILTIAHRLNTIIDSDRVMVLDRGHIAEFDPPHILLQKEEGEGSIFKGMVEKMGPAAFSRLALIAQESFLQSRH